MLTVLMSAAEVAQVLLRVGWSNLYGLPILIELVSFMTICTQAEHMKWTAKYTTFAVQLLDLAN